MPGGQSALCGSLDIHLLSNPERGRKKTVIVETGPKVPGSHSSCGEGSTLAPIHFFSQLGLSALLRLHRHLLLGRRQAAHIAVTNKGSECHLLVALRDVSQAEGAERFQVS